MITPEIETERLILREVHKEDVDDIFNCWMQDEKVNHASANVLHKLGFKDEAEISYECSGGDIITDGMICRYISK